MSDVRHMIQLDHVVPVRHDFLFLIVSNAAFSRLFLSVRTQGMRQCRNFLEEWLVPLDA